MIFELYAAPNEMTIPLNNLLEGTLRLPQIWKFKVEGRNARSRVSQASLIKDMRA